MTYIQTLLLALATRIVLSTAAVDNCPNGLTLCTPPGATNTHTPQIGSPDFESLYISLLHSSLPPPQKRSAADGTASLCCISSLSCLTMRNLALPFCYDRFTTNYYLPDTSFGTLSMGTYNSRLGDAANLTSGDFVLKNGTHGNIYASNPSLKPDASTLPLPTQFTASGVGPAIPASALGGEVTVTYVTTLPGSTVAATTRPESTVPESVETKTFLYPQTITKTMSGIVMQDTVAFTSFALETDAARTVDKTTVEGTTVEGVVTTVTTTTRETSSSGSSGASSSATASSTKKGSGNELVVRGQEWVALLVAAAAGFILIGG